MFELGNTLREARIRRHLDLMDAEADTKIRKKYLHALELEEFDVLPGPVFARGFLRTYANYLGLDGQLYLDEFNARFLHQDLEHDQLLGAALPGRRRIRVPGLRTIAVVSLVVLAVLSWFALHTGDRPADQRSRAPRRIDGPGTSRDTVATTPRAGGSATTATAAASDAPKADGQAHLRVSAVGGDSWVQVQRGSSDGPILWAGTLHKGEQRRFRSPRLVVSVGYPAVVLLRGGGTALRPTGAEAAKFVVTPSGLRQAA
jgi:cytoskeletal protein RodZ